ncbi:MAG: hypothetical protein FWE41_04900 [Coriobacteriia bacterium]|nr:hypothetical protein [Coriobacteriia bacterium]MCL2751098.1 hypothetical protein [Coriobacteriia bacterium]
MVQRDGVSVVQRWYRGTGLVYQFRRNWYTNPVPLYHLCTTLTPSLCTKKDKP